MVGIIVMTHGSLGEGLVDAAELITGPIAQVETLSLRREDNVNDLAAALLAALERMDTGDGVLVLADLLGGSPCNVAGMNLREKSYQVLSGANLPMLIEALSCRETAGSPKELAEVCANAGVQGVKNINQLLGK